MEVGEEGYIASFRSRRARAAVWTLAGLAWAASAAAWCMSTYWFVSNILCMGGPVAYSLLLECAHPAIGGWPWFVSLWTTMALTAIATGLGTFLYDEWTLAPCDLEKLQ